MNILLVSQYLTGGGLERMVHSLGEALAKHFDCKIFLFSFDNQDDPELRAKLEKLGIKTIHEPKGKGFSIKLLFRLVELIKLNNIDVVHTHESAPLIYASLAIKLSLRKVRLVHTQHSFIHLKHRPFIRFYDRFFQSLAQQTVAVSKQVQHEYVNIGVAERRVKLISNGVEFPSKMLAKVEKLNFRKQLINELAKKDSYVAAQLQGHIDSHWMISVARVHPQKGQDHLIKVWANLSPQTRASSILLLVGPETYPGEKNRLIKMIETYPDKARIVFLGATSEPVSWLQAADLFLSGSEYEGMPLAPIEACGAGLPLVLSDIEGHEVLKKYAHYFNFKDSQAGAKVVDQMIADFEKNSDAVVAESVKNALEIQNQYSTKKMAAEYYNIYNA